MEVIKYSQEYRGEVEKICLQTSGAGDTERQQNYILGMYCKYYLDENQAFLLCEIEKVIGYILYAKEYESYASVIERGNFRLFHKLMVHGELQGYEAYKEDYPAHLHIDVLREYTGKGLGYLLMDALTAELDKEKIKGVMLQVAANNKNAIKFYERCGFHYLKDGKTVKYMGLKLGEASNE